MSAYINRYNVLLALGVWGVRRANTGIRKYSKSSMDDLRAGEKIIEYGKAKGGLLILMIGTAFVQFLNYRTPAKAFKVVVIGLLSVNDETRDELLPGKLALAINRIARVILGSE